MGTQDGELGLEIKGIAVSRHSLECWGTIVNGGGGELLSVALPTHMVAGLQDRGTSALGEGRACLLGGFGEVQWPFFLGHLLWLLYFSPYLL